MHFIYIYIYEIAQSPPLTFQNATKVSTWRWAPGGCNWRGRHGLWGNLQVSHLHRKSRRTCTCGSMAAGPVDRRLMRKDVPKNNGIGPLVQVLIVPFLLLRPPSWTIVDWYRTPTCILGINRIITSIFWINFQVLSRTRNKYQILNIDLLYMKINVFYVNVRVYATICMQMHFEKTNLFKIYRFTWCFEWIIWGSREAKQL